MNLASNACPYCGQRAEPIAAPNYKCQRCGRRLIAIKDAADDLETLLPAVVGEYTVLDRAGRGGMGHVFRGRHAPTETPVAIKFPTVGSELNPRARAQFGREIDMLKGVDHAHVVRVLAHGEEAGCPYFVMEWIDGEDLAGVLADCESRLAFLPIPVVRDCFLQLCGALSALHAVGIVHRDVKPANIMLMPDRTVRLIDLGIAKTAARPVDRTTGRVGTFAYMAPELLSGKAATDRRTDIYGLGVVVYEMLTNQLPMGYFKPPSRINQTVPSSFDDVVMRMLEHEPEDRPACVANVAALVAAQWNTATNSVPPATPTGPPEAAVAEADGPIGPVGAPGTPIKSSEASGAARPVRESGPTLTQCMMIAPVLVGLSIAAGVVVTSLVPRSEIARILLYCMLLGLWTGAIAILKNVASRRASPVPGEARAGAQTADVPIKPGEAAGDIRQTAGEVSHLVTIRSTGADDRTRWSFRRELRSLPAAWGVFSAILAFGFVVIVIPLLIVVLRSR